MNLYTVSQALSQIIETEMGEGGEISDETLEKILALEVERDALALDLAALAKQEYAVAAAVKDQAKALAERARSYEERAARYEQAIERAIPVGTKLRDARAEISWRKSKAVHILEESLLPDEMMRVPEVVAEPNKKAIAEALKAGKTVPGAELEERINLQIR